MKQGIDWCQIERDVLEHLLPFQRRTVEWAFNRLYGTDGQARSHRFLVADEVGLGKTLVAKAVVAKALNFLAGKVQRIDVVYVCSNEEIAAQNLARLRIEGLPIWPPEAQNIQHRIALATQVFLGQSQLPRMPVDLPEVLSWLAVAGPATCALRSLGPVDDAHDGVARAAASSVGLALMAYLSNEQMVGQLEWQYPAVGSFWRRVLALCADGCWPAVLDEYVAVLAHDRPESVDPDDALLTWLAVPAGIASVMSINPTVLKPESAVPAQSGFELVSRSVTLRRARPLLERDSKDQGGEGASSMTELRNAFNSPFMPFVLSSTSVGQEGLDFHWYCHAIVHWNVPRSPVDFEQRDGRIHRYRNHAVRRNIAHDWGRVAFAVREEGGAAQWKAMFQASSRGMVNAGADMEGMKPSWIYQRGERSLDEHRVPTWLALQQGCHRPP